jgi:Mn-containing catalase
VCLQYFFQALGSRGPTKYRDMLLQTATEEIGHIEMLATAGALNLEGAPVSQQDEAAKDPMIAAILGGMNPRHILSTGLAALPENSNGVPFNASHVYASGNIAGDMLANATAEATGRTLACRLFAATDDPGMKDMWRLLIARDTMHQQQWLAVIEELGGFESQLRSRTASLRARSCKSSATCSLRIRLMARLRSQDASRTVPRSMAKAISRFSKTGRLDKSRSLRRPSRLASPRRNK